MKIKVLVTLLFIIIELNAQDTMMTLFHFNKINQFGIYVQPELSYGQSSGDQTLFGGGSTMIILNNKLAIGPAIQKNIIKSYSPASVTPLILNTMFLGGKLEYTIFPQSVIHLSIPLTVGCGFVDLDSLVKIKSYKDNKFKNQIKDTKISNIYVAQLGLNLETNLIRYMKFYIGGNYRIAAKINLIDPISEKALKGFSMNTGFKIGLFNYKLKPCRLFNPKNY